MGLTVASTAIGETDAVGATPNGALPRMPLEEFVQDSQLLAALRKGVREMKRRKPSDPLSWFYQAAIHGVTPEAIDKASRTDPDVNRVFKKRYWNQCPHDGENSANFLPWHRGYTYYFEKILRMHTGEDRFSLPYWDYTQKSNRKFPKEFGIKHLDGNLDNDADDNINPLYLAERDFYFTGYEHPFATGLPLLELSDSAVDIALPMGSPIFFGEIEREGVGGGIADEDRSTRGLFESYPHDHIHRAVGGIIDSSEGKESLGAMATPPTAGFDPIFSIHHCNMDRLWATWSCVPGKQWGKLPPVYWFEERPWFFFDVDAQLINEPRKTCFDHRAMGIRFKYEDMNCQPLRLPDMRAEKAQLKAAKEKMTLIAEVPASVAVLGAGRTVVPMTALKQHFTTLISAMRGATNLAQPGRISIRLQSVEVGLIQGAGFDVHLTANPNRELARTSPSFLGSVALFRHGGSGADLHHGDAMDETFDLMRSLARLGDSDLENLSVVVVPYSLFAVAGGGTTQLNRQFLKIRGFQLMRTE